MKYRQIRSLLQAASSLLDERDGIDRQLAHILDQIAETVQRIDGMSKGSANVIQFPVNGQSHAIVSKGKPEFGSNHRALE
ncbi:MAG: hypothetical protein GX970_08100 [Phyllobacteriaceae bacterium]|nr:hypothetical protein [Phyllobacteriaceae bacterium]